MVKSNKMTRERVKIVVTDNDRHIWIPWQVGCGLINVSQRIMDKDSEGRMVITTRYAQVIDKIEKIMQYEQGGVLNGNIYIRERLSPPDPEDELNLLAYNEHGVVETLNGKYLWRWYEYSCSEDACDEYAPRQGVTVDH